MDASATSPKYVIRIPLSSLVRPNTSSLFFRSLDKIIRGNFTFGRSADVVCDDSNGWIKSKPTDERGSLISREHLKFSFNDDTGDFGIINIGMNHCNDFVSREHVDPITLASIRPSDQAPLTNALMLGILETNYSGSVKLPAERFHIDTGEDPVNQRCLRFIDTKIKNSIFCGKEPPLLSFSARDVASDLLLDIEPVANTSRLVPENSELLKSLPEINGSSPFHFVGRCKNSETQFQYPQDLLQQDSFTLVIGQRRDEVNNNFTTDNSKVSANHLSFNLEKEKQEILIEDLMSTYGTYLWFHEAKPSLEDFKPEQLASSRSHLLALKQGWTVCLAGVIFIRNDPKTQTVTISEHGKTPVVISTV